MPWRASFSLHEQCMPYRMSFYTSKKTYAMEGEFAQLHGCIGIYFNFWILTKELEDFFSNHFIEENADQKDLATQSNR